MSSTTAVRPGAYVPLFTLEVLHRYYAGGRCALHFEPTADTADWLRRTDAVCRELPSRLEVLLPASQLALWAAGDGPTLGWSASPQDPQFHNVTEGLGEVPGRGFHFDGSRLRTADDGGAPWLHDGAHAALDDTCCTEAAGLGPQLGGGRRRAPWTPLMLSLPWPLLRAGGAAFRVALAARAPVWKYWLVGEWSTEALQVVDLAQQVDFSAPVAEALDDGSPALAVRSSAGIELRQRSDARFQLRSRGAAAERVLVKRLPVAGADHFARETIHGVSTLVSEIYVHR